MSRVSIVVPIYNAEKYLDNCIKSILKQTFEDLELILVNDGSSDDRLSICEKYRNSDSRIHLINKNNEGSIVARRKGIEASKSPYITFVDAEDWINKDAIKILYKEKTDHNLDIAVCNSYRVLGSGKLIKKKNTSWYFDKDKFYSRNEIKKELAVAYFHGHPFPANLGGKFIKESYY
ncbi:glycosyltransferase family 2 protein [Peribacillus psychrosaccharolyticus]|uniref:glycosyltransferase family 2 protein n=1 Tax=Peribacillus psychrosaccharolyticus TaxID=1407 RepID=UPI001F44CE2A|nr:glycosyltransferase family 2 protein [Peribacillus psychrosaccharolyticus]MEC2056050.1 glycosyltransferase family 2 protein [Peribacillus psychrosaccharolyticus]MED3745491.1 glycosyltransferase family 2 protein [Peribacillus psychrosaccharolyticus]